MNDKVKTMLLPVIIFLVAAGITVFKMQSDTIKALQAKVEEYRPYYTATLAATYGTDGIVTKQEVDDAYAETEALYAEHGITLSDYGWDSKLKLQALHKAVESGILMQKAVEYGLDQLTEEEQNVITTTVNDTMDTYINSYITTNYPNSEATDELKAEAEVYLASQGLDRETYIANLTHDKILEKLELYITADVEVTDEDVRNSYDQLVTEQLNLYSTNADEYIAAVVDGDFVIWSPDGFRNVKQLLIMFDDDQQSRYAELSQTLTSLQAELDSLDTKYTDVTTRTEEEITADIKACNDEMDALFAEVSDRVTKVQEEIAAGRDFDDLVKTYSEDPYLNADDPVQAYPVCEQNDYWDAAYNAAAFSIENIGDVSEPVRGRYGVVFLYYDSDVAGGEIPFDDIKDTIRERALTSAKDTRYNEMLTTWVKEANPVYYYENFGLTEVDDQN